MLPLVAVLGLVAGTGLWLAADALFPTRPRLADLIRPHPPDSPPAPAPAPAATTRAVGEEGWAGRLGARLAPALMAAGLPGPRTRADLAALNIPVERHLAEKAATALLGFAAPWLLSATAAVAGLPTGWLTPAGLALALALGGFYLPDLTLRSRVAAWRQEVRHALSTLLDITAISLSGGAGVEQSLRDAAAEGHGEAFAAFHRALREAEITHTPPWERLQALGERLGVAELDELACSLTLAGSEGARVRTSLVAKAASVRAHLLADAEAAASSATEKMSVPVTVMLAGFLLTLGFPAVAHALQAL